MKEPVLTRSTQVGTSSLPERLRWDAYAEMKASALIDIVVSLCQRTGFHNNDKDGAHLMSRTPGILSCVERRRDYLEDGAEWDGRVVGGGLWIVASGKIEFEASRQFCAVLRLVSFLFRRAFIKALMLSCRRVELGMSSCLPTFNFFLSSTSHD